MSRTQFDLFGAPRPVWPEGFRYEPEVIDARTEGLVLEAVRALPFRDFAFQGFGEVVGISLLSPCTFRLRRPSGTGFDRVTLTAEPRSAYLLSGPARDEWEHSIPGVEALRYSVTYRNLRES